MDELKKYDIDIFRLAEKEYHFQYSSDSRFFRAYPQELIQDGKFSAEIDLVKSSSMIRMNFRINGEVTRVCDRSLETFNEPFETRNRIFLKFGDRDEELTDEIEMIAHSTQKVNVARYIFDFIVLALPVKSLHPRFRAEADQEGVDEILVYSDQVDGQNTDSEETDPRWEALKNIKKQ